MAIDAKCSNTCAQEEEKLCECSPQVGKAGAQFCPADLKCNRAKMRLQWQPYPGQAGLKQKVCVCVC